MSLLEPSNKAYWLARLCESNYDKIRGLIPCFKQIGDTATAIVEGKPALHIRVLERGPYTLTLELTHSFSEGFELLFEPALRLRVYLDARAVEVLSDNDRPCLVRAMEANPKPRQVLDYKWQLNYFLSRWLDHCAESRFCFASSDQTDSIMPVSA